MASGHNPFTLSPAFVQNYSIAPSFSRIPSTTSGVQIPSTSTIVPQPKPQAQGYKPPAHKHAHHLHSIPPREKSTRTLIIDHMLWVHGRTRFAQARAELGMTDRTGGHSSTHYSHRHRPENYDEDDQAGSDGEDVERLKSRALRPADDDEEERMSDQDFALARSLRLRAEGLERVVTAMLDQPPVTVHPIDEDDIFSPPTSPKLGPSKPPHVLPNGVRLRLSLGTMINDFFARQAPPPVYRHHHRPKDERSDEVTAIDSEYTAPPTLRALYTISSHPNSSDLPPYARPRPSDRVLSMYTAGADPNTANAPPALRCPRHLHTSCEICVEAKSRVKLGQSGTGNRNTSHSKSPVVSHPYPPGSTPQSAPSPATSSVYTPSSTAYNLSYNPVSSYTSTYPRAHSASSLSNGGGALSGWQDGSGIGSGLSRPGAGGSCLRRTPSFTSHQSGSSPSGVTGAGNTKLSELILRYLRLSALVAMELGREMEEDRSSLAGSTSGSTVINQDPLWFERRESIGNTALMTDPNVGSPRSPMQLYPLAGPSSPSIRRSSISGTTASTQPQMSSQSLPPSSPQKVSPYTYALQPSREWYMLTAGLLTRAVLEGYLTAGWRGVEAIECLLTVGLGMIDAPGSQGSPTEANEPLSGDRGSSEASSQDRPSNIFEEFDPDDLPNLQDATRIMFPSLRSRSESNGEDGGAQMPSSRTFTEDEYAVEMMDRLRRFYDIPESTPDLSTHMEDLAWQYPAEPVERAAVRFCEAISRWRGKPELETYKKNPPPSISGASGTLGGDVPSTPGGTALTLDSLVHSSPISPHNHATHSSHRSGKTARRSKIMPSIEKYFLPPSTAVNPVGDQDVAWNRNNKRIRPPEDTRTGSAKRVHV